MNIFSVRFLRLCLLPLRRLIRNIERPRYLLKWVGISTLIGIVAGVGAITFYSAVHLASGLLLGSIVGYLPPEPGGGGSTRILSLWASARPWLLPMVTTLGGLVVGIFVFWLAPEAEGHGTDAAIAAFHQGTSIRVRIPLVKLIASAITIGTGGSAGLEGPAVQISAGFGSILATLFRLDAQDRRIALATGIGAGIGAIFRAPLGGAILAAEILYQSDLEVEALIPALMASIVGYSIFGAWYGWGPIFATPDNLMFTSPLQLFYYVVLGLLCGLLGRLYARGFYGITHLFHRLSIPNWLKPAIGGLVVGLIGLAMPQALGIGDGWIQVGMESGLLALPLWVLLLLPLVKILTTGLSIGSGGSGGIFGPGLVIGGTAGALLWRLGYHLLPGFPVLPAPFVIVGMMALLGGIAHVPIAGMLMVAEMTGDFSLLAPAMIAVSVSYLLVGKRTIYISQLQTRAEAPAHRHQFTIPLLATLTVRQAMIPLQEQFDLGQTVAKAETNLASQEISAVPGLDGQERLSDVLTHIDIEQIVAEKQTKRYVEEAIRRKVLVFHPDRTLDEALEVLTTHHVNWALVGETKGLTQDQQVVGMVSIAGIVRLYREAAMKDSPCMHGMIEYTTKQAKKRRANDVTDWPRVA